MILIMFPLHVPVCTLWVFQINFPPQKPKTQLDVYLLKLNIWKQNNLLLWFQTIHYHVVMTSHEQAFCFCKCHITCLFLLHINIFWCCLPSFLMSSTWTLLCNFINPNVHHCIPLPNHSCLDIFFVISTSYLFLSFNIMTIFQCSFVHCSQNHNVSNLPFMVLDYGWFYTSI